MTNVLLHSPLGCYICVAASENHFYLLDRGWEELDSGSWHYLEGISSIYCNKDSFITPSFDGFLKICDIYSDFYDFKQ